MRILIIAFYEVFPPASGAATVTYNCARFLSGEKFLLQLSRSRREILPGTQTRLISVGVPQDRSVKKAIGLGKRLPRIAAAITDIQPNWVILEGASWTMYFFILLRLVRNFRKKLKIVYHAHNVEYLLRKNNNGPLVVGLTKWAEKHVLENADFVTAVSDVDAQSFRRLYGVRPILLPNGVDPERFQAVIPDEIEAVRRKYCLNGKIVLFMGLTGFRPNREAIEFLTERVFPVVHGHLPDARLVVIGGPLEIKRDWLIAPGSVPYEEVPAFIKASQVCVAPIFSGSGTRLKILEYMAAGKPVVSTAKGAEGIHVEDGKSIYLADEENFSTAIESLLLDSDLGANLGDAGRRVIAHEYAWKPILADFERRLTLAWS